jgi:chorismate mutase
MKIEDWRAEIDAIDAELVRLLNRRAQLAVEVGKMKRAAGLSIFDPDREHDVLARACRTNVGPLDDQAIIRLFRRIIRESRRVEVRAVKAAESHSHEVLR